MGKLNQKGIIHLAVVLILLAGIAATVYLVNRPETLKFLPKAAGSPTTTQSVPAAGAAGKATWKPIWERIRNTFSGRQTPTPTPFATAAERKLLSNAASPINSNDDRIVLEVLQSGAGSNSRYKVEYQPPFHLFLLVILDTPIDKIRQEAEAALLNQAGGDQKELCKLNIHVTVPAFVTGGIAETDNKLNICK